VGEGGLGGCCARTTRTRGRCSLDARNGNHPGRPHQFITFSQVRVGEEWGRGRIRKERETPYPEIYGARAAVGDYRLGGRGGVDGGQYAGSVLAMDVLRAVGDGRGHCDCDQLGEEEIVQRDTGIERWESIMKEGRRHECSLCSQNAHDQNVLVRCAQ
jgi:hypothetical protein